VLRRRLGLGAAAWLQVHWLEQALDAQYTKASYQLGQVLLDRSTERQDDKVGRSAGLAEVVHGEGGGQDDKVGRSAGLAAVV